MGKFTELLDVVDLNGIGARWTPLIWAIQKNRIWAIHQIFATNQLINFKKQIEHKGKRTVLHFAAERGNMELVALFLKKDKEQQISANYKSLDINALDKRQCTALLSAAKVGDEEVVEYLLKNDADPNISNSDQICPLLIASHRGHIEVVKELLKSKRTDINKKDSRGRTALMVSCAEDRKDVVKELLKFKHIDMNAKDIQNYNWNCLMWCIYRKNEEIMSMILSRDKTNKLEYFHASMFEKNSLDMCVEKNISKHLQKKLRAKFHGVLFPKLIRSPLIRSLHVPIAVCGAILVFT